MVVGIAFRFHVNLYHSYRGDSLDERGIGKDLRVIRGILADLERLNREGIPARGTWDIENYYSLELYLPRHAPDIIDGIRARVRAGMDEVEPMSYNNGIVPAHDEAEADRAVAWAISNPAGSGLADLFGEWAPIVRPQECMFTPSDIDLYRRHGIEAVSLYYSAIPFNGFGNFVPPLPTARRHNPLLIRGAEGGPALTLLPAYNHGDIVERGLSVRSWLKALRREQNAAGDREDMLLLLDMDADDYFWEGLRLPLPPRLVPSFGGLYRLVKSIADLPFLRFARPGDYLRDHPPTGEAIVGQDCADGSWDGFSSWAEKRENAEVWTVLDRSRRLASAAARAAPQDAAVSAALDGALSARVLALSTTHFGMASPVMNAGRLRDAFGRAREAEAAGEAALSLARAPAAADGSARRTVRFLDPEIDRLLPGRGSLIALEEGDDGAELSGPFRWNEVLGGRVLAAANPPGARWEAGEGPSVTGAAPRASADRLTASDFDLAIAADGSAFLRSADAGDLSVALRPPRVRYARRDLAAAAVERRVLPAEASGAAVETSGSLRFPGGRAASWRRRFIALGGLPYLYVEIDIDYPRTPERGFSAAKAARLGRAWDARWREAAPCELLPELDARADRPVTVWKHNFRDEATSYRVDYHRFGPNRRIASVNNHVTDAWVAVSDGRRGVLVAQSSAALSSFAFCPLRTSIRGRAQRVALNPFGSYAGPQLRSPTASCGFGAFAAVRMGNQYDPYAPSWSGGRLRAFLMIACYEGDAPPEGLRRDAALFAWTPVRI